MDEIETKYQSAVDRLASESLLLSEQALVEYPDYGTVVVGEIEVGFWHTHRAGGIHHIVFMAERRLSRIIPFYRKYLAGVLLGPDTPTRLMTEMEVADYD